MPRKSASTGGTAQQEKTRLLQAALAFLLDTPWIWMSNEDVFAVEDPISRQTGYCSIMGCGGEEFGLLVFLGERGWERLRAVHEGAYPEDRETNLMTPLLSFSLTRYEDLQPNDLKFLRETGLHARAGDPVPFFRSQRPGYAPWRLDPAEIVFLTAALREARVVASKSLQRKVDTMYKPGQVKVLTRCLKAGHWVDEWRNLPGKAEVKAGALSNVQTMRLRMLDALVGRKSGTWEADFYLISLPVGEEGEPPYFPFCIMLVDSLSGQVDGAELIEPWISHDQQRDHLIQLLEKARRLPAVIRYQSESTRRLLLPVAEALGIRLEMGVLPNLMEAKYSFESALGGGTGRRPKRP
jgi:hypothetical protein